MTTNSFHCGYSWCSVPGLHGPADHSAAYDATPEETYLGPDDDEYPDGCAGGSASIESHLAHDH